MRWSLFLCDDPARQWIVRVAGERRVLYVDGARALAIRRVGAWNTPQLVAGDVSGEQSTTWLQVGRPPEALSTEFACFREESISAGDSGCERSTARAVKISVVLPVLRCRVVFIGLDSLASMTKAGNPCRADSRKSGDLFLVALMIG